MTKRSVIAAVAALAASLTISQVALAEWRPAPPRTSNGCAIPPGGYGCSYYQAVTAGKQGAPFMIGTWQNECNRAAQGDGMVAVYWYNPAWVYTQCYGRFTNRKG
jgi:hypothetical protein